MTTFPSFLNTSISTSFLDSTFYYFSRTYLWIRLLLMFLYLKRWTICFINHKNRCLLFYIYTLFLHLFFLIGMFHLSYFCCSMWWKFFSYSASFFSFTSLSERKSSKAIKLRIYWFMSLNYILILSWNVSIRFNLNSSINFLNTFLLLLNIFLIFKFPHFINNILIFISKRISSSTMFITMISWSF